MALYTCVYKNPDMNGTALSATDKTEKTRPLSSDETNLEVMERNVGATIGPNPEKTAPIIY